MKKFYIIALSALIGFSSCDPLGIEPTTDVFEEQFWENAELSRSFVNQFYKWSPAGANDQFQSEQWSDNAVGNINIDQNTFRQYQFNNREYDELNGIGLINAPWVEGYKNIREANLGIERIPTVANIVESEKNQLLGECYAFRAQFYFDLERYWGGVPLILNSMTVFDETMLPRNSREEVFTQILSDYDKALEHFALAGTKPPLGLINTDAVQVLKSRAALTAANASEASANGVYDKLNGSAESKAIFKFTKDAKYYYDIAYNSSKAVIGKYSLDPSYRNLFNTADGNKSVESIWPMMFNELNRGGFNPARFSHPGNDSYMYGATAAFSPKWTGNHGNAYPTQELVDSYYQKDKASGKWMQWWKTSQAMDMGVTVDAEGNIKGKSADYQSMYADRDHRFYTTVLYDGSYYAGVEKEMYLIGTWIDYSEPTISEKYSALHTTYRGSENLVIYNRAQSTMTSYYPAKYVPGRFNPDGTLNITQTSISYFMVRYAEALLNNAEAAYKLGGKEAEVLNAVNQIRNRAGLDNFDAAVVGHDLWTEYKQQRRVEFAYEVPGHRYFDLLRWSESEGKQTIEELNENSKGMYIFRKGVESTVIGEFGYPVAKSDPEYFTPYFEVRSIENTYFERKFNEAVFYKLPFSRTTMESNLKIVQNPGWENKSYK